MVDSGLNKKISARCYQHRRMRPLPYQICMQNKEEQKRVNYTTKDFQWSMWCCVCKKLIPSEHVSPRLYAVLYADAHGDIRSDSAHLCPVCHNPLNLGCSHLFISLPTGTLTLPR